MMVVVLKHDWTTARNYVCICCLVGVDSLIMQGWWHLLGTSVVLCFKHTKKLLRSSSREVLLSQFNGTGL